MYCPGFTSAYEPNDHGLRSHALRITRPFHAAADGGAIGKIRTGDLIRFDAEKGELDVLINEAEWLAREHAHADLRKNAHGTGRELFAGFRSLSSSAETGAMSFGGDFA